MYTLSSQALGVHIRQATQAHALVFMYCVKLTEMSMYVHHVIVNIIFACIIALYFDCSTIGQNLDILTSDEIVQVCIHA